MSLEVKDIYKSFEQKQVLHGISFKAEQGMALGLLGRNGAGKSTTIRIIMNIFAPDKGEVLIEGKKNFDFGGKIGYLPEERGLYPKKLVCDQMVYIGELRGLSTSEAKKRALSLLERLEAGEHFKKRLETLSKGNQQKIQLAIALINDPQIIILDEPFSGLDPVNANILKSVVSELVQKGKTVIFSSHEMAAVEEFCDHICLINKGEIVLNGNIKNIKNTYPKNNILITMQNMENDELARKMVDDVAIKSLASNIKATKKGVILTLFKPENKNEILKHLSETNQDVENFCVVEPTLEEIFIEKVGETK